MLRTARLALLPILASALVALVAVPAQAKTSARVPYGFVGTTFDTELTNPRLVPDATLDQQAALMADSGVESLRLVVDWSSLEPTQGAYTFDRLDRMVRLTAAHRLQLFVGVTASPRWASASFSDPQEYWRARPRDPAALARMMRLLVLRYGPKGTFWAANPAIPRTPVRQWQVWNEPTAPWFWSTQPFAPSYAKQLKAAYRAIKGADKGALVATGGLVAAPTPQWDSLRALYKAGAKKSFDVVAVHPFTNDPRSVKRTVKQSLELVRRVRAVMRRYHDTRKRIFLTEVTWPAAVGHIPAGSLNGLESDAKGQAARLHDVWGALAKSRRKLGLGALYWYTWATDYITGSLRSTQSYRYSGLTRRSSDGVFTPMPVLRTFSNLATRLEGCRKTSGRATACPRR